MNIYNPASSGNLFQNSYQLEKYIKHTAPTSASHNFNSVFTDPSTVAYKDYIVSTVNSGSVEVDNRNSVNITWVASKDTGMSFKNGSFHSKTDAVKVVFHDNQFKIHAYPIPSTGVLRKKCNICGKLTL